MLNVVLHVNAQVYQCYVCGQCINYPSCVGARGILASVVTVLWPQTDVDFVGNFKTYVIR